MVAGRGGPQAVRVEGYRGALAEAGIDPHIVIDEAFSEMGGTRATEAILAAAGARAHLRGQRPDGHRRHAGAARAGIESREIAVVGFDDIPAARLVTPPLTTVAQFQDRMGARAAEILMERLRATHRSEPRRRCPFNFVERGSA